MGKAPKFLLDLPPEKMNQEVLNVLDNHVIRFQRLEKIIEEKELEVKLNKEELTRLSQEEIPTLLSTYGLSEIKLKSGKKVIVKKNASVSVPDDKQEAFYAFLKERDEEDIIKLHFHFSRMPTEKMVALFTFLTEGEFVYDSDRGVHSQTLKKYFKELLGIGEEDQEEGIAEGRYLRKETVTDIVNIFIYFKTTIK